jgi:toxin HigB-1
MIASFACKETEKIFNRRFSQKLQVDIHQAALRKLMYLHAATTLNDLRIPPGNHLEQLGGSRKGQHCIRINDQWRICFIWAENNAHNVEIVDYHK